MPNSRKDFVEQFAAMDIQQTREYRAIAAHYGTRVAARSQVPLIHHIDEGLAILAHLGASAAAQRAYCLHPLVQEDAELAARASRLHELSDDPVVIALAFEYRNVANAALSSRPISSAADISLSPLSEVNAMLVADKVQNRADFLAHHLGTHTRSDALDRYFRLWLERLGIDEPCYSELVATARARR